MPSIYKILAALILIYSFASCSNKISKRIKADVITKQDTSTTSITNVDTVKVYDSLQMYFGDKLSVPYDSILDIKLYSFIKENLGKKCYGNSKSGFNCEGFLSKLYTDVYKIDFPVTPPLQMKFKNIELFKDSSYLKQGDVIFFNYSLKEPDKISHTGLYLQNGYFLAATYNEGVVITKLNSKYWSKHFVAAGRLERLQSNGDNK
jgi:probable lipoprotein NlpC